MKTGHLPAALIAMMVPLSGTAGAGAVALPDDKATTVAFEGDAPVGAQVKRGADGLFYVHGSVNGRVVRFMIDTGASVTVLTAADAQAAGIVVPDEHYNASVDTVGGSARMAWATVAHIKLAGYEVHGLRAAVVRNGLPVSLLGQNMLARFQSVTMTQDQVSLR